ncbi:hypothetical protein C8F01DRAFT_1158797 [Mycena amicta]|nr:hypothetical protein C8F01DRAFT_1158797 [Mycena amicta]
MSPSTFLLPIVFLGALVVPFVSAAPAPTPVLVTVLAPVPETGINSAHILGVDAAGHTTYAIDQPVVQDSTLTLAVYTGTATLVAGSDYASETISASFSQSDLTFGIQGETFFTVSAGNLVYEDTGEDGKVATITTDAAQTSLLTMVLDVAPTSTAKTGSAMAVAGMSFSVLVAGAAAIGLLGMTI